MNQTLNLIREAKVASPVLMEITPDRISSILKEIASRLEADCGNILDANRLDLSALDPGNPDYDRLLLTEERIRGIATDMAAVSRLPVPYGQTISKEVRPNDMIIRKVSVPFGVIGVIYEARPNVTADVFSLCFKAGNACVLKGGHEAARSSEAIVSVIHSVLHEEGLPEALCTLLPPDRDSAAMMMEAVDYVDVIIPRGGKGLINYVRTHSKVPVIETGAGVCHTFISPTADTEKSRAVVFNSKTRRVSVCNSLDCVIINSSRLQDLAAICRPLADKNVVIYADGRASAALRGSYPDDLLREADEMSFGTEFRDYKMAIKTVDTLDEAIAHIGCYGSRHSECIMSEDPNEIETFQKRVDAACVYANVSTAFTDGGQFGFGAEIGISTQKLHARGPMALPELTTYKYLISGNGQVRN